MRKEGGGPEEGGGQKEVTGAWAGCGQDPLEDTPASRAPSSGDSHPGEVDLCCLAQPLRDQLGPPGAAQPSAGSPSGAPLPPAPCRHPARVHACTPSPDTRGEHPLLGPSRRLCPSWPSAPELGSGPSMPQG